MPAVPPQEHVTGQPAGHTMHDLHLAPWARQAREEAALIQAQATRTLHRHQTTWVHWRWAPWTWMLGSTMTCQASPTCSGMATSPRTMPQAATQAASRSAANPAAGAAAGGARGRALRLQRLHPSCPCSRGELVAWRGEPPTFEAQSATWSDLTWALQHAQFVLCMRCVSSDEHCNGFASMSAPQDWSRY